MKKIYSFIVAAIAVLVSVSCSTQLAPDMTTGKYSDIIFTAYSELSTKTVLGNSNNGIRPVTWNGDEKITVNGTEFEIIETNKDGVVARFGTSDLSFKKADVYQAIYPASAGKSFEKITISSSQDGTFANASISVAQSEDKELRFKNLASMLKFQVQVECSSVTIESTAPLAGTVSVSFDEDGNPVLGEVSSSSTTIKIENNLVTGTDYYVAVLPGAHQFTVKMESVVAKASNETVTLARAQLGNLKTLPRPDVTIYAMISPLSWTKANMVLGNTSTAMTKVTVEGREYYKATVPFNTKETLKFNNGGTTASNWRVVVNEDKAFTIGADKYYRLSPNGAREIDPKDETTFGYALYVFDQKDKQQTPTLYVWDDNGAFNNLHYADFAKWPGVNFKYQSYYQPGNGSNWKRYYQYEIPTSLYGKSFKFIVNKDGKNQTSNQTVSKVTGDIYVGYWYNDANNFGFWTNSDFSTIINQ